MLCFDCRSVICYCSELVRLFVCFYLVAQALKIFGKLFVTSLDRQIVRQLFSQSVRKWVQILLSTTYLRTSANDAAFLPSGFDNGIKYNESVYRKYQNICLGTRQAPYTLLYLCLHTEVQDEISVCLTRDSFCVSN